MGSQKHTKYVSATINQLHMILSFVQLSVAFGINSRFVEKDIKIICEYKTYLLFSMKIIFNFF
jgi:hypothetical protein